MWRSGRHFTARCVSGETPPFPAWHARRKKPRPGPDPRIRSVGRPHEPIMNAAAGTMPTTDRAYRQRIDDVAASLGTDVRRGLTTQEAQARLDRLGRNELTAKPRVPAWRRFLVQFQDVLVILLLVATAISTALWAYEPDTALPYEAIAILAVILLNAAMGYVQT